MSGERKQTIFKYSTELAEELKITFANCEFNYGKGCGRADNYYSIDENRTLILEIEHKQRHPEANVLKVWPYLENNRNSKIFLLQYIPNIKEVSPNRIEMCKWTSKRMEKDLEGRFFYYLIENKIENYKELKERIELFLK